MENSLIKESAILTCNNVLGENCTGSCNTDCCDPGCCGKDRFNFNNSDGLGGIVVSLNLRG